MFFDRELVEALEGAVFFDRELVEALEVLCPFAWQGLVYRHMFADNDPLLENRRGARWNPASVAAIYTSLERDTVLAEAEHQIASQPLKPRARRTVFTINVGLSSVLDLREPTVLARVGLDRQSLTDTDWSRCQLVGGAAEWLGRDGLLIPSARTRGTNLVIFPNMQDEEMEVVDSEVIFE